MWHSWTKSIIANPGENIWPRFLHFSYFTNKCMSLGIFQLDQSNYVCPWKQKDFNTFQLSLYCDSLQTKLAIASNIQCKMSKSYRGQQKCWTHPFKIMILFAWSWSTNYFMQKSIIKHLFDPVDSLYTVLTYQSLNHQQL